MELKCANCSKIFNRPKSRVRSVNSFCTVKCRNEGQGKGLTAPMRLGTGCNIETKLIKRKFYKYVLFDRARGFENSLMQGGVHQFVKLIKTSRCLYCDSIKDLGFDRIDNSKGHSENNVVIACRICNMTRGNRFTVEQMKQLGKIINSFNL